jgi:K+-transporting ATPase A subunit
VRASETSSFLALLAKKISRIDRRFAAYARLKNKKSAENGRTRQQQRHSNNNYTTKTNNNGNSFGFSIKTKFFNLPLNLKLFSVRFISQQQKLRL